MTEKKTTSAGNSRKITAEQIEAQRPKIVAWCRGKSRGDSEEDAEECASSTIVVLFQKYLGQELHSANLATLAIDIARKDRLARIRKRDTETRHREGSKAEEGKDPTGSLEAKRRLREIANGVDIGIAAVAIQFGDDMKVTTPDMLEPERLEAELQDLQERYAFAARDTGDPRAHAVAAVLAALTSRTSAADELEKVATKYLDGDHWLNETRNEQFDKLVRVVVSRNAVQVVNTIGPILRAHTRLSTWHGEDAHRATIAEVQKLLDDSLEDRPTKTAKKVLRLLGCPESEIKKILDKKRTDKSRANRKAKTQPKM